MVVARSPDATAAGRATCGAGRGAGEPPATLAEITLGASAAALDFYDVSLVDGYNMAIDMRPYHGFGTNCLPAGCVSDLNSVCPVGLAVRGVGGNKVVGCRSAEYCCTGQFGGPQQCKPTTYSRLFKRACPKAYSYAYDYKTSILTCVAGTSYVVAFCPHRR